MLNHYCSWWITMFPNKIIIFHHKITIVRSKWRSTVAAPLPNRFRGKAWTSCTACWAWRKRSCWNEAGELGESLWSLSLSIYSIIYIVIYIYSDIYIYRYIRIMGIYHIMVALKSIGCWSHFLADCEVCCRPHLVTSLEWWRLQFAT